MSNSSNFDSSNLRVSSGEMKKGPASTNTTSSKKKKNLGPPLSVEEIFNQISGVASSNINPPPGNILLTPRSAECCLKLGVNPEILKIRDIDSFWEHGIEPAVQRIRHEAYVQRRHEIMKQCRVERKRLINKEFEATTNMNQTATMTPEMVLEQQRQQNSTLIQMELQRIEKMQKRQEKELEQMIQLEINRAKLQQDFQSRMTEDKKKEDLKKKQREKRMKLMAEEVRLREMQKVAIEEAEEENRRAVAREMHDREISLIEEHQRTQAEGRRAAIDKDLEKKKKHEEHRMETQKFFEEEQMKLRQRLESMNYAEKKKQDAILERQREHAETLRKKREMVEARIEKNMEFAKQIDEKRKNDFLDKQDQFDKIREAHLQKQEEDRELHAQEILLQEQRRRMILIGKRKEEEKKAETLLVKFEEDEMHVEKVQEMRERELQIHKEKKDLMRQMKYENVDRVGRVKEYQRISTLKKIEDTDSRIKNMLDQRQTLIQERRRAAAETKKQKDAIAKVMEEVRTNATKANKLISQALTGKLSFSDLTSTGGGGGTRSKSAAEKSVKKNKTTSHLLGLDRESKSAGDNSDVDASQHNFLTTSDATASKPYVSPYDSIV